MTARITALTFDLWNTIYSADGAATDIVRPRRLELLAEVLALHGVHPSDDELRQAYRTGFDAYMAAWTSGRHFGAREQVLHILGYFGVGDGVLAGAGCGAAAHGTLGGASGPVDLEAVARTAAAIEDASRIAPPSLLPGVRETIPALAVAGYSLGLISDTSLTPGRVLREFLEHDGLLDCFMALTFSDETGYPKPDRRMFESTLAALGAHPVRAAHVGDIPRTDIAGAQALGMVTIRCAAVNDHTEPPEADFVIKDHREIPAILSRSS